MVRVKELRESKGMSQKILAEKAGVAQSTVHYIESGGNATQKTLLKIAEALEVPLTSLLATNKAVNE